MDLSIFGACDIRGIYPDQINEIGAKEIGRVCAKLFNPGKIIIAHDIRHGSPELSKSFAEGLSQASGVKHEIEFVGLSTTPMFYFLVNNMEASGGCMVTASHNPKDYNGLKIVREKGQMISGTDIRDALDKK
jgi:phosphomannomutase